MTVSALGSRPPGSRPVIWLLLSICAAASMGYYVEAIWGANQPEQFSDLYAPWWAAHELLLHGRNPYSPAVAHEIQGVIYGSQVAVSADDPNGIAGGFAYPPYATLLLWPLIHTGFPTAQKIFVFFSVLLTVLSLALWVRALRLRLSAVSWVALALFVMGSFPVLQGIKLQNLSLMAAGLLAIAVALLAGNRLILSGIFLAGCTFKPQFTVALMIWLVLWTCADWRRRRLLIWSFLGGLSVLVAVSQWLVPDWISSFLGVVKAYRHYTYGHSLLDVWFAPSVSPFVSAGLLLGVLALCWPHRSQAADSPRFLLATSLLLAANVVVIPTLAPHAQLLLLPGFLCLLPAVNARWVSSSVARMARSAVWMLTVWPWVAAFVLLGTAVSLPVARLHRFWEVPLYTSPVIPLAVALALAFLVGGASNLENPEV
jgi:hypothetical protein